MAHSLTGTISMGEKHGGEREHCLWSALCFTSRMHLQWHNKDAASQDLWMETLCRCLCCKSLRSTKVPGKHHPHTSVIRHPIFWWTFTQLRPCSSLQSLGFFSSFITYVPRFSVSTTVDVDELPILRQRTGLLWCPPFGVTSGLLWKDVRVLNVI